MELTQIGRLVNNVHCLQLLLELAVHFTMVTATTYCLLCAFTSKLRTMINSAKIIAMAISACVYSFKVILINYVCTSVSDEV